MTTDRPKTDSVEGIRRKDNFENSRQYIVEQLFCTTTSTSGTSGIDYTNTNDRQILKKKIWVLDGPIRQEEMIDSYIPPQKAIQSLDLQPVADAGGISSGNTLNFNLDTNTYTCSASGDITEAQDISKCIINSFATTTTSGSSGTDTLSLSGETESYTAITSGSSSEKVVFQQKEGFEHWIPPIKITGTSTNIDKVIINVIQEGSLEYFKGDTPDKNVKYPMNHFATLMNDLTYLDKYIRTEEKRLEEDEPNFDSFWEQRIEQKENWINTKNPNTGEYYKDWEQPYSIRPTLLEKDDFSCLYDELVSFTSETSGASGMSGEIKNAFDIVKSITDYCIDQEALNAEKQVLNSVPPSATEAELEQKADSNKKQNDIMYVDDMQKIHDDLWDIFFSELYDEDTLNTESTETTATSAEEAVFVNLPTKRDQIVLEKNHETHRGNIIRQTGEGGYRFKYRDKDQNIIDLSEKYPNYTSYVSPDRCKQTETFPNGQLEDSWEDLILAGIYMEDATTITYTLEPIKNINDLSSDGKERFDKLNKRWENINNLREYEIADIGTRGIIESMINAEVPDLKPDKIYHLRDRKLEKIYYTNILQEERSEFK